VIAFPQLKTLDGSSLSPIGLGTWKSDPGEIGPVIREALGIGYRHIDCAPIYGNEAEIGEALEVTVAAGEATRESLWITSKLWNACHLPEDVRPALERTLSDLRQEVLDLFLIHWPVALRPEVGMGLPQQPDDFLSPDEAPIAETWSAMEELVEHGLCRHIGVSNFSVAKLEALCEGARIAPACNQVECHPYLAQPQLLESCRRHGVLLTGYSPLGSPDRPERVRGEADPVLLEDPVVAEVARAAEATPAQVLLAWAVRRGGSAVPKSVSSKRLRENLDALELKLDEEQMKALDGLDGRHRYIDGSLWCPEGSPYTVEWLWED